MNAARHLAGRAALAACLIAAGLAALPPRRASADAQVPNVILFVADGLRAGMVNERTAPAMHALVGRGVRFANSHALFPTFTTANASGMATGHELGDTGDFSNTIYTGFRVPSAANSVTPFLENDAVLGDVDDHFAGNYLGEETILKAARDQGYSTATIGKVGPALIFDHTARDGSTTVVVDDLTGRAGGIPLSADIRQGLTQAHLADQAPTRGENGKAGTDTLPGTKVANVQQQDYFVKVAADVVLPLFKSRGKPFVLVFWSRDPDGTQHFQGDSLNRLIPGINGATSLASIKNADDNLAALLDALKRLGLERNTDVIVTSDHGFSTISKESATSWAASRTYADVEPGLLPPGFVAMDIAHGLDLPLYDPDANNARVTTYPIHCNGLIGADPAHPQVVVAANGGSDLIYLPTGDKALAARVAKVLAGEDYTSGLFVDDSLGRIPGTLPLSAISMEGAAATPTPSMSINFRTFSVGCADPLDCGVEVADTTLQQGQGMHGSFSRADTLNIMGAAGPSFRQAFMDRLPASNADIGKTIAEIMKLRVPDKGHLIGRVLTEAMPDGATPAVEGGVERSQPDSLGNVTVLLYQRVGSTRYFDAAGYPGRTLGLPASP